MEWNLHKIEGMRGDHNLTEEQNSYVNWTKNPCWRLAMNETKRKEEDLKKCACYFEKTASWLPNKVEK